MLIPSMRDQSELLYPFSPCVIRDVFPSMVKDKLSTLTPTNSVTNTDCNETNQKYL